MFSHGQTIFKSIKSSNFTTLSNLLLRDKNLSFKARGLLAMVLSNSGEWEVQSGWLCENGTEGREAIRSAMRELESHGYARFVETRNEYQRIISTYWEFHETPVDDALKTNKTRWRGRKQPNTAKTSTSQRAPASDPMDGGPRGGNPKVCKPLYGKPSPKNNNRKEENGTEDNPKEIPPSSAEDGFLFPKSETASVPDNPGFKDLISCWEKEYHQAHGYKYSFGKRDFKAAKELLANKHTVAELIRAAKKAWETRNSFCCKQAATLYGFCTNYMGILGEIKDQKQKHIPL